MHPIFAYNRALQATIWPPEGLPLARPLGPEVILIGGAHVTSVACWVRVEGANAAIGSVELKEFVQKHGKTRILAMGMHMFKL